MEIVGDGTSSSIELKAVSVHELKPMNSMSFPTTSKLEKVRKVVVLGFIKLRLKHWVL